ncbi:MAG TPA: homoserine O-acetyltransferase [Thermoanaerobaculia bacterium]|nr:homoserine O-acetyltransferase [Thermoanaerobaculia bacterium]
MAEPHLIGDTFLTPPPTLLTIPEGFRFRSEEVIAPFSIAYETFGELNEDRSNAILVCHALSPSAHAAGKYSETDPKPGWWDGLIGYGKAFDLRHDFVVCVNFPGSCWGTTAPSSINPRTGRPWGSAYPQVTIHDMIEAERAVVDALGISRLKAVAGGSLGGMQVLMWGALHPERAASLISMAAAAAVPVEGMAWHVIGRKIIESDPAFRGGDYYENGSTLRGLEVARMVGHMTYLSQEALEQKFGRRRRGSTRQFEIDSYLEYQGKKFAQSYDANSYIRVQRAMDEMDLEEEFGSLPKAFARFDGRALLISFDTDWLFPPAEVLKVYSAFSALGVRSEYHEIVTTNGHDAFLIDYDLITPLVNDFLAGPEKTKAETSTHLNPL